MAANDVQCCEPMFWVYLVICVALVCFAGLMSGLTLGLMSISLLDLEVLAKAGQPQDRKNAEKILPIVKNHHLLLCTLLISNSIAMEALPIFVDGLLPAWGAILVSVTLVLAFGEIIPQALCSRYGLSVGAKFSFLVRLLVLVLLPISYPISKLLDWLLGEGHSALLGRAELKTLVNMHGYKAGKGGELTDDETAIIIGALDMTQKTAKDAMTPIPEIFSLDINSKLDEIYDCLPLYGLLNEFQKGHSHIAVVIKSKKEVTENPEKEANPSMIKLNMNLNSSQRHLIIKGIDQHSDHKIQMPTLDNVTKLSNSLSPHSNKWNRGDGKFLNEDSGSLPNLDEEAIGIITLEDVMEELLQEEILDETDEYVDGHKKININMLPSKISPLRSPAAAASAPHFQWQTPVASPFHSYYHTPLSSNIHSPILNSPISPYLQFSPSIRTTLSASPEKVMPNYSPIYAGGARYSPSLHKVSRKLYEKLRQPDGP
ncbi:hypothetical protein ACJW30_12G051300 [Castanea mollissima]